MKQTSILGDHFRHSSGVLNPLKRCSAGGVPGIALHTAFGQSQRTDIKSSARDNFRAVHAPMHRRSGPPRLREQPAMQITDIQHKAMHFS
jgi:hypothetical protein